MKKLLLLGAFALVCLFSNAQDGLKGTWFAGGQVAFGSNKHYVGDTKIKSDNYTIQPLVGTFISPDVAIGAALGYVHTKNPTLSNTEVKDNTFIIQPFVRKYWNITGGLYFFGQGALPVSFGTEKTELANGTSKVKTTSVSIALSPGFDYIVTNWLTVEASFTLLSAGFKSEKPDGGKSSNSFNFDGNTHQNKIGDVAIGVKFLF